MKLTEISTLVKRIPHTGPEKGAVIYEAIRQNRFQSCLELGFACGAGSSYIAAALDENGGGRLTAVDMPVARERRPSGPELLDRVGLAGYVDFVFHELGYNWFLIDALESGTRYDFCFLDGAHTWDVDALAFLIVAKILKPGGIIIFDDLDWTYAKSPTMKDKPVPDRVRTTPAIRKIVELLVQPNADFEWLGEKEGLGLARRR